MTGATPPAPGLAWLHRYVPAPEAGEAQGAAADVPPGTLTLLLLHGTGGDENSLVGLGRLVAPAANLLAVRGRSLDEGAPRFFRRFSATSYDQENIVAEARALGEFTRQAATVYGFEPRGLVALGYSNGANIALATLALDPGAFAGAVLLRAVMPLEEPPTVELAGKPVLLLSGARDPYAPHAVGVGPYLRGAGAEFEEVTIGAGHELVEEDVRRVSDWLASFGRAAAAGRA